MNLNSQTLVAADGTPLKKKLQQSLLRSKLRAFGLVSPLLIFLLLLFGSINNDTINSNICATDSTDSRTS